ncbi:MAG: hypothetical protein ACREIW_00405 [Chthoniobacterales bacterium]
MSAASDLTRVSPSLLVWQAYDPAVKADLSSTAIVTANGIYLVDPIPLDQDSLNELVRLGPVRRIIVTNANHWRAAPEFGVKFSVPIVAKTESLPANSDVVFHGISDGTKIDQELSAMAIDGAAPGEIALFSAPAGGTLIVGDALINFEPLGFALLPAKYCTNHRAMRRSLRKLLCCEAERIFFAHGSPITTKAGKRLRQLLDADPD